MAPSKEQWDLVSTIDVWLRIIGRDQLIGLTSVLRIGWQSRVLVRRVKTVMGYVAVVVPTFSLKLVRLGIRDEPLPKASTCCLSDRCVYGYAEWQARCGCEGWGGDGNGMRRVGRIVQIICST